METLDRCFENVCELDLIFHVDKVHNILTEICMGGVVMETSIAEVVSHVEAQNKMEKSESSPTTALKVCPPSLTDIVVLLTLSYSRARCLLHQIERSLLSSRYKSPIISNYLLQN